MAGQGGEPGELSLVDKGVRSLLEVSLSSDLHTLNMHCNRIARIEGLGHLRNLQHLDLSSNQIRRMEGLSALESLRSLNLSCNLITAVEGLEKLFNLTTLNLSYNRIHDLSGFQCLHGTHHKISCIDLRSNCINNINHLLQCTKGLQCLTNLTLEKYGNTNPVCYAAGYRESVLQALPQLAVLDGRNIHGEPVESTEGSCSNLQCLEDILNCLTSSGSPSSKDQKALPLVTPHIDQALAYFRQRTKVPVQSSVSSSTERVSSSEPEKSILDKIQSEMRIQKLEDQISQILQKVSDASRREASPNVLKAKRDTDPTSESEHETEKENSKKAVKRSKIPTYHRTTLSARRHLNHPKTRITDREEKSSSKRSPSYQRNSHLNSSSDSPNLEVVGRRADVLIGRQSNMEKVDDVNSNATEESTYRALIQELDQEKERRWKAEQAEKKLVEHVKELQKHAKEEKNIQSMAVYTTERLKEMILKEKDIKMRLQTDVQQLKDETERLTNELNQAKNKEAEHQKAMQALEEALSKMETQRLQQRAIEMKQVQEAELKASANERELQLLRVSLRQQREKVKQLHELLILREREQRKELETRVALHGPEFQAAVSKEVAKEEQRHEQRVKDFEEKINTLNQKYTELEDEFRLALRIEAKRFKEVQEDFENVSADLAEHQQALFEFQQKEKEMTVLIQDLTSIVKEQKAKIAELLKSNQETTANLKNRTEELETVIEQDKEKAGQVELLKKENGKLISQLTAQESVIDGLKMERKIWGQELAQQGAHLSQDRGKLEAKIEVLTNEVEILKKQREQDSDAIRIKNKIVDDQTETIRRLKEGLQERDKQIRKQHEEHKRFQVQLDEKATEFEELMEKLERQNERKEQLKQRLEEKEVELDDMRRAHSALKKKWQGKDELLSQLEVQVKQMKESFDMKEKKLIEERNKSLQAQRIATERLREMDDTFRKQLESVLAAHEAEIVQLANEKEKQIEAANEKVYYVEEEMRQLLQETASSKKAMEDKIKRITYVLNDIQQDL
ncbi:leucine-rich repeat and coiled-coil domain-containing protein 1 isoform X1 [Lagopus leucura]|uniref:leucine-rich repeat and coiled-coil domain-containing protein 1 isoform X1 n=1 Tax=Lagopus leucura TaxID=30410 RepID=UPI001C671D41|nr:leucine-rich repeat and coiled-coil domain-containing protein 1 isoform X1 [Lagopus leucura]